MRNSKVHNGYLIVAGFILALIGGATLLMPVEMKASSGIDLADNVSVINDVRASSAVLLFSGVLIFLGALTPSLKFTSSLISAVLFIAIGLGRVLSVLLDGIPVEGQLGATGLELVLGTIGTILFITHRNHQ